MSTSKALTYALEVTAVSGVLLSIMNGLPTSEQLISGSVTMFVVAFIVMRFIVGAVKRQDRGKE